MDEAFLMLSVELRDRNGGSTTSMVIRWREPWRLAMRLTGYTVERRRSGGTCSTTL